MGPTKDTILGVSISLLVCVIEYRFHGWTYGRWLWLVAYLSAYGIFKEYQLYHQRFSDHDIGVARFRYLTKQGIALLFVMVIFGLGTVDFMMYGWSLPSSVSFHIAIFLYFYFPDYAERRLAKINGPEYLSEIQISSIISFFLSCFTFLGLYFFFEGLRKNIPFVYQSGALSALSGCFLTYYKLFRLKVTDSRAP